MSRFMADVHPTPSSLVDHSSEPKGGSLHLCTLAWACPRFPRGLADPFLGLLQMQGQLTRGFLETGGGRRSRSDPWAAELGGGAEVSFCTPSSPLKQHTEGQPQDGFGERLLPGFPSQAWWEVGGEGERTGPGPGHHLG